MGELLAVALSKRGEESLRKKKKTWAVLASRLMASSSSCSLLVCQHKQHGEVTPDSVPGSPVSLRLLDNTEHNLGHTWDTVDPLDYSCGTVLPDFHAYADCFDRKWHGMDKEQSGMIIIMVIFYFVFFHINVSLKKKRKTLSVSGNVTFLFFQVRHLNFFFQFIFMVTVIISFYSFKRKAQNFISKGKKTAIFSTNIFILYQ